MIDGSVSNVTVKLGKEIRYLGYGLGTMGNSGQGIGGKRIVIFLIRPYLRLFILWVLFGEGGTPRDSTLGPNKRNLGGKTIRFMAMGLIWGCWFNKAG